jgi:hypothetical protein
VKYLNSFSTRKIGFDLDPIALNAQDSPTRHKFSSCKRRCIADDECAAFTYKKDDKYKNSCALYKENDIMPNNGIMRFKTNNRTSYWKQGIHFRDVRTNKLSGIAAASLPVMGRAMPGDGTVDYTNWTHFENEIQSNPMGEPTIISKSNNQDYNKLNLTENIGIAGGKQKPIDITPATGWGQQLFKYYNAREQNEEGFIGNMLGGSSIFEGATILEDAKTNINVLERSHKLFSNEIKATQKELETAKANYVRFQDISGFDSDTLDSLTLDSQLMYLSKNYIYVLWILLLLVSTVFLIIIIKKK